MAEHRQGFKGKLNNGSVSGSKKYNFLIKAFSQGYSFEVWAREAELGTIEINGLISNKLSFFSIEEEYFIEQFKPILNK